MMNSRNRLPFTATQWQELEHQALVYKYMISGLPVPPHLLYAIRRPLSTELFPLHSQHVGWNCFQMGMGRKIDPEPGRCRRTDGKKWRCSKDAYPDSKYCERHMHRGKNRSRKPVELSSSSSTPSSLSSLSLSAHHVRPSSTRNNTFSLPTHQPSPHSLSPYSSETPQFLYPDTSSSRLLGMGLSLQENNTTHLFLDSRSCSQPNIDEYRHVDEHAFFSEHSGTIRMENSWNFTPLSMSSCSKQNDSINFHQHGGEHRLKETKRDQHLYILGNDIKCHDMQREEPQKTVHRFIDEWPLKSKDSWLGLDDKSTNNFSASSATRLSISIPTSSHDSQIQF